MFRRRSSLDTTVAEILFCPEGEKMELTNDKGEHRYIMATWRRVKRERIKVHGHCDTCTISMLSIVSKEDGADDEGFVQHMLEASKYDLSEGNQ